MMLFVEQESAFVCEPGVDIHLPHKINSMALFRALVMVSALAVAAVASQEATIQSVLLCEPKEVEMNKNITCFIFARSLVQEAVTGFSPSDFTVRVTPASGDVTVYETKPVLGDDPTTAKFYVLANKGTTLRVDVSLTSSGLYIRDSGAVIDVLSWPASVLKDLQCTPTVLTLRSTATCTATVQGPNGEAAVLHNDDVYFSEDHDEGSFSFLQGVRTLKFNFTAPSSLSVVLQSFYLRVTISGSATVYSVELPMQYPIMAPTARSTVRCSNSLNGQPCIVSAADETGPVSFDSSKFFVSWAKKVVSSSGSESWVNVTDTLSYAYATGSSDASRQLVFAPLLEKEVYSARLKVTVQTASGGRADIINSPFYFTMGVAPNCNQLTFGSCATAFITSSGTTVCTIHVASGVTADPTGLVIAPTLKGAGVTEAPHFAIEASTNASVIQFTYKAPVVSVRSNEYLNALMGGCPIVNDPYRLVVYPADTSTGYVDKDESTRPALIIVGLLFFGGILLAGAIVYIRMQMGKGHHHEQAPKELDAM